MDGVTDLRINTSLDHVGPSNKAIRWTQVFFLQSNEGSASVQPVDLSRLAEKLASATCASLGPTLPLLAESGFFKLALRVTIDSENVSFEQRKHNYLYIISSKL